MANEQFKEKDFEKIYQEIGLKEGHTLEHLVNVAGSLYSVFGNVLDKENLIDGCKKVFVNEYHNFLEDIEEPELKLYKQCLEDLCKSDDYFAKFIYAEHHVLYNLAYLTDLKAAEKLFLELLPIENEYQKEVANYLGYIYHERAINEDSKFYEKAFYYYSMATLFNHEGAQVSAAKMLMQGEGVPVNINYAKFNIQQVKNCSLDMFLLDYGENYLFAAAHAAGSLVLKAVEEGLDLGEGYEISYSNALRYFYMAKYAYDACIFATDTVEGQELLLDIIDKIEYCEKHVEFKPDSENQTGPYYLDTFGYEDPVHDDNDQLCLKISKREDGTYKFTLSYYMDVDGALKPSDRSHFMLIVPPARYCQKVDEINYIGDKDTQIILDGEVMDEDFLIHLTDVGMAYDYLDGKQFGGLQIVSSFYLSLTLPEENDEPPF
ncbi:MAG: hypothetical protein MJ189_01775 [Coriobacteriales bacterium]|nr:hypothetical protein [Coriobacteriales bacterium]